MFWPTPTNGVVREAGLWSAVSILINRQQQCGYRLLAALNTQPARNILPVTLRDDDEQAPSGEQPENEDL